MKDTIYFLIFERLVGKKEDGGYFLFSNGEWIPDTGNVIMDHLMGYDPSEPEDSPYRIGNLSIMDEIEEISRERAESLIVALKEKEALL